MTRIGVGFAGYSAKEPKINEVWLAKFPYAQNGNWFKLRPVLIVGIKTDSVLVRKITTRQKAKYNSPIHFNGDNNTKQSYLCYEKTNIERYRLVRKIGNNEK